MRKKRELTGNERTSRFARPFRGTLALLGAHLSALKVMTRFGFFLGLIAGLVASFTGLDGAGLRPWISFGELVFALVASVFGFALISQELQATANASRRDELLVAPLGVWALPAASLLLCLLIFTTLTLACIFGLTLTATWPVVRGASPLAVVNWAAYADMRTVQLRDLFPIAMLTLLLALTSLGSLGGSRAQSAGMWIVPWGAGLMSAALTGHLEGAVFQVYIFWGFALFLQFTLLPFALYVLPRSVWFYDRSWGRESIEVGIINLLAFDCLAWLTIGFGFWTISGNVLALLAFLAIAWRTPRAQLRRRTATSWALILTTPLNLGMASAVVRTERATLASLVPGAAQCAEDALLLSPDHRSALVRIISADAATREQSVLDDALAVSVTNSVTSTRLAALYLCDVQGQRPPLRLPIERSAELKEQCSWSVDGRYLAVSENTLGRIWVGPLSLQEIDSKRLGSRWRLIQSLQSRRTLIVDTQNQSMNWLGYRVLAPGWRSPEELISLDISSSGAIRLAQTLEKKLTSAHSGARN